MALPCLRAMAFDPHDTDSAAPPKGGGTPRMVFPLIERAKRQWEATVDAIPAAVGLVGRDGRLLRGNTALATLLGVRVQDLPGRLCGEGLAHHADGGCPVARLHAGEQAPGEVRTIAWHEPAEDGGPRILEERVHPVPDDPDGAVVLVLEDVTARHRAEAQIRRLLDETRRANSALEQSYRDLEAAQTRMVQAEKASTLAHLAAGLAHEIHNPLAFVAANVRHLERGAAVLGRAVDRLRGQLRAFDPEADDRFEDRERVSRARADLPEIVADTRHGAERIRRIVAAIADLVPTPGPWEPVDVDKATRAAVDRALARAGTAGPSVTVEAGGAGVVSGRRAELEQAITKLVDNALEATRSAGRGVGVRVVTGGDASGAWVHVLDRGAGPSDEALERAFDPFWPNHPVDGGFRLGLGLTLASGIATRHGGEVRLLPREAVSDDGSGARGALQTLRIPRTPPTARPPSSHRTRTARRPDLPDGPAGLT